MFFNGCNMTVSVFLRLFHICVSDMLFVEYIPKAVQKKGLVPLHYTPEMLTTINKVVTYGITSVIGR